MSIAQQSSPVLVGDISEFDVMSATELMTTRSVNGLRLVGFEYGAERVDGAKWPQTTMHEKTTPKQGLLCRDELRIVQFRRLL